MSGYVPAKHLLYKSILFVCDVNTCRSPMAEALLKKMLAELEDKSISLQVHSGGIALYAREGGLVSLDAKLLMKEEMADSFLEGFRSKDLKRHIDLVKGADLILTMTQRQKEQIQEIEEAKEKEVYTLREFAGENGDIADPGGQGDLAYSRCKEEIKRLLEIATKRLLPSPSP